MCMCPVVKSPKGISRKKSEDIQCRDIFLLSVNNTEVNKVKKLKVCSLAVSLLRLTTVNSLVCILPDLFYAFT